MLGWLRPPVFNICLQFQSHICRPQGGWLRGTFDHLWLPYKLTRRVLHRRRLVKRPKMAGFLETQGHGRPSGRR